ncbi:MAG: VacJ family lipoprotein, partial [Proteobacteria bacterium]|nr:VacJ family lipoprotein [Pseudomonadota bacterium]
MRLLHNIVMALVMVLSLSGCASLPAEQRAASDPWEAMNRPLFRVNVGADSVITKPLAKGYRAIMPGPVRTGVSNFARNLTTPRSAINNFLQGKPANGFSEIARFLFNSTLGLAGIFDVATAGGMEEYREDFGQTAAVWGVPDGPYVMLPILGPQTLRDALLIPLDILADPMFY